jgi:hypothetical protein
VVAVAASGEIVGHMGLTIRDPRAETADAGNSIVDPRYRGQQIVAHLALAVIELCRNDGFLGFHHYPTTVHPIMQKLALAGGTETGIMLDYIPSGTEYREIEGAPRSDRPAVVVVYHPLRTAPARAVFAPEKVIGLIEAMYARAELARTVEPGTQALPSCSTDLRVSHNPRRGLARIEVTRIGRDLVKKTRAELARLDAPVCQLDVPMSDETVSAAVESLRPLGFFFSAVLPEWLEGDVLRLQRIAGKLVRPELVSPEANKIFDVIEADYRHGKHEGRA